MDGVPAFYLGIAVTSCISLAIVAIVWNGAYAAGRIVGDGEGYARAQAEELAAARKRLERCDKFYKSIDDE